MRRRSLERQTVPEEGAIVDLQQSIASIWWSDVHQKPSPQCRANTGKRIQQPGTEAILPSAGGKETQANTGNGTGMLNGAFGALRPK